MTPKPQALLLLLLPLLLLSPVTAFDILEILKPLNEYSTFAQYLIEANLVDEINSRDNITVLAIKDSEISPISSLPTEVRKNVMSVHVLLGYYDPYSISHLHDKSTLVPTLFQTTGLATNQNGYVKVSKKPMRQIVFGSGVPGSPSDAYLINVVGANSDTISILHISDPIIPSGIESVKKTPALPVTTPPTASSPTKQTTPAPTATSPTASPPTKQETPAPVATPPTDSSVSSPVATPPTASSPTKEVTPAPVATPPTASSPTKEVTSAPVATPPTASSPTKQVTPAPVATSPTASSPPTPALAPTEKAAATAPANAPKTTPSPTEAPQASASAPSIENVPEAPATSTEAVGEVPTSPSSAGRVVVGATIGLAMGVILLGAC